MEDGVAPGFRSPQYGLKGIFSCRFVSGRRKLHYKGRPSQLRFPDLDSPPVGLHYLGGYGQAEATASRVLRARTVDTIEALEDPLALILGDAGARVLDGDADEGGIGPDAHPNLAPLGAILDGVRDEVVDDLAEAQTIGDQSRIPRTALCDRELYPLGACLGRKERDRLSRDLEDIHFLKSSSSSPDSIVSSSRRESMRRESRIVSSCIDRRVAMSSG